ncbi:MAG: hypothetical protein CM1200mP35_06510 [Chloroflexota bacterium]|nr:MAG: hypothetical protein CM1200mP35_06510 [Chloroflexota bacterium]
MDTHISRRRSTLHYENIQQDGIELLVSPNLFHNTDQLSLELKQFLFMKRLKATADFAERNSTRAIGILIIFLMN